MKYSLLVIALCAFTPIKPMDELSSKKPAPTALHKVQTLDDIKELVVNPEAGMRSWKLKDPALLITRDSKKRTPLHRAKSWQIARCLLYLAEMHGIENYVNFQDARGREAIFYATPDTIKLFLENGSRRTYTPRGDAGMPLRLTPLHLTRYPEVAQAIIDSGVRVDVMDGKGRTPLHTVQNVDVAEVLLRAGANPDAQDSKGYTPLHYARNAAIAQALMKKGARRSVGDNQKNTPLHVQTNVEVVRALRKDGASRLVRNAYERTPLQHFLYRISQKEIQISRDKAIEIARWLILGEAAEAEVLVDQALEEAQKEYMPFGRTESRFDGLNNGYSLRTISDAAALAALRDDNPPPQSGTGGSRRTNFVPGPGGVVRNPVYGAILPGASKF